MDTKEADDVARAINWLRRSVTDDQISMRLIYKSLQENLFRTSEQANKIMSSVFTRSWKKRMDEVGWCEEA